MYSKLKACVRLDSNYPDIFTCNVGLIQLEFLSPLLYSLYVNDIEVELINQGCQSYELKKLNLFLLMYADDTVIFSENVEDLQNLINSVNVIANDHGLYVNLNETQIVVCRSRGNAKPEERWSLNGNPVEICDDFVYLGLLFHYNGSFLHTQQSLSNQGRKALFNLYNKIHDDCFNHETLMSLFDTYISYILSYGCETWGSHKGEDIEKVHINLLKRTLKVRRAAANVMVYFELRRVPMYVERHY